MGKALVPACRPARIGCTPQTDGARILSDAAAPDAGPAIPPADRRFLGHPAGLGILSVAEAWERFSYAGMQALLVLYATHYLFLPGNVERVWGMAGFRHAMAAVYGPLGPQALASATFGLYAGLVYVTPLLGGLAADRWLGRTPTVVLGAILLTIGHTLMGHEATFLPALLALVLGVGCFKANITAQVGELYAAGDPRRAAAFQIFVMAIATAAVVAPLVCGTLGERVSWAWGFGAAGIGMVIGLACYLGGRRWLPPDVPRRRDRGTGKGLAPGDAPVIVVLVLLLPVLAVGAIGNEQMFNAYLLWGEANYRLEFLGRTMPVTWLISIDAFIAIAAMAGSLAFWRWYATRRTEPDEIDKLAIGTILCALAPLILVAASLRATGGNKVSLGWGIAFHVVNEVGFANFYPVGLALYSRCAPRPVASTIMAAYFLNLAASNMMVGWLGGLLERMSGAAFWAMHAGLIACAAIVLLAIRRVAGRLLAPTAGGAAVAHLAFT